MVVFYLKIVKIKHCREGEEDFLYVKSFKNLFIIGQM